MRKTLFFCALSIPIAVFGQLSKLDSALIEIELYGLDAKKMWYAGLSEGEIHAVSAAYWIGRYNTREAFKELQQVKNTDSAFTHLAETIKAEVFMRTFRYDSAVRHLSRMVKKYPQDPSALNALGFALIRIDRIPEALEFLAKARSQMRYNCEPCDSITLDANVLLGEAMKGSKQKWSERQVQDLYRAAEDKGCTENEIVYLYFVASYLFDDKELVSSSLAEGLSRALSIKDDHLAALLLDRFTTEGTNKDLMRLQAHLVSMDFDGIPELQAIVSQFMFITYFQEGKIDMAKSYNERFRRYKTESQQMYRAAGISFSEAQVDLMTTQVERAITNGKDIHESRWSNLWLVVFIVVLLGGATVVIIKFLK
ncbi:MAG: hypothetical protein IM613_17980 [Cytophagales bacterium]|nr:hypothetical protein [Cytophagales bacterium]